MQDNDKMASIELRRIERALHELRSGYPVVLADEHQALLVYGAESFVPDHDSEALKPEQLVLAASRLQHLGIPVREGTKAAVLPLSGLPRSYQQLREIILPSGEAAPQPLEWKGKAAPASALALSALQLVKLAYLLPAALVKPLDRAAIESSLSEHHLLLVSEKSVEAYVKEQATGLEQVSEARVPLVAAENARVMAFRPRYGATEHLAIIIGDPQAQDAPLVRLHSSCVTGDILGSLRCDCGEQLQEAIRQVAETGHGVVLYLSQEGRGIGISNKLRAYGLQDAGMDTVDANEALGFAADERVFAPAAAMLDALGIHQLKLLTNNPDKVRALEAAGVKVMERVPLVMAANPHNRDYLATKEKRCGHLF